MNRNKIWRFMEDLIFHDFWRKLVALFLALLLYLAIAPRTGEKREKTFHNIPVHIELPPDLALSGSEMHKVKLVLSGNADALDNVDPGALNIQAEVHAEGVVPGTPYPLRLRAGNVNNLPRGVKVISISPRDIPLELEPVISKPVRIEPDFSSSLSRDYALDGVDFLPTGIVTVSGPAKLVNPINVISTNPILLDKNVTQSFDAACTVKGIPGIRINRTEFTAKVRIRKILVEREREIPIKIFQSAESTRQYKISDPKPYYVIIKLKGTQSALALLSDRDIVASINLDNIDKPGTYTLAVNIAVNNPHVTVVECNPEAATVTVEPITLNQNTEKIVPASAARE